ncbi:MAG: hypothetical protein PVG06_18420 [Desulfobacterales bacterium]
MISTTTTDFDFPGGRFNLMDNKNIKVDDLLPEVKAAGAMNLIVLATEAQGTLSF